MYLDKLKAIMVSKHLTLQTKQWKGANYSYRFKCNICGYEDTATYVALVGKRLCHICQPSLSIRWNTDKCRAYCEYIDTGTIFAPSNMYTTSHKPYLFICGCGCEFTRTWHSFYNKQAYKCGVCSGVGVQWTTEKCHDHCAKYNIELLTEKYMGYSHIHKFKCSCGIIFTKTWREFVHGAYIGCTQCSSKNIHWTHSLVQYYLQPHGVILLDDQYINNKTEMRFKCVCGDVFTNNWSNMLAKNQPVCNYCSAKRRDWTIEKIQKIIGINDWPTLLSDTYINMHQKLLFQCHCGQHFRKSWRDFYNNNQRLCNCCAGQISHGERMIKQFLDDHQIIYYQEHRFDACKDQRALPFDFYIPQYNILIEFDGEQHFFPVAFGDMTKEEAVTSFHVTKKHDQIKNQFAKEQSIDLVRIDYTQRQNIYQLLQELFGL